MKRLASLEKRLQYRIKVKADNVFILSDFDDLSDKNQVGRALRKLVKKQVLAKIGQGIYAKIKKSSITGNIVLNGQLKDIAKEALQKYGYKIGESYYQKLYREGKTLQVPLGMVVAVKGRTSRKIEYKGYRVEYEKAV
ncbi:MAG: hypothetical protein GY793_01940 [Proteobacteria bacterium]|nr:hypothetical protein [Pseudomonadota bacterium]